MICCCRHGVSAFARSFPYSVENNRWVNIADIRCSLDEKSETGTKQTLRPRWQDWKYANYNGESRFALIASDSSALTGKRAKNRKLPHPIRLFYVLATWINITLYWILFKYFRKLRHSSARWERFSFPLLHSKTLWCGFSCDSTEKKWSRVTWGESRVSYE